MNYSLEWLKEKFENEKIKYLFFWNNANTTSEITSACFSQWFESSFIVDSIIFRTSEHWMMAQKALLFDDVDSYERIINAKSPGEAKELGREIINFNQEKWDSKRFEIVVKGNIYKFSQNQKLLDFLLNTNDRVLVEASPIDEIWGIGLSANDDNAKNPNQWNGLNLLGFALMEVRDILRK